MAEDYVEYLFNVSDITDKETKNNELIKTEEDKKYYAKALEKVNIHYEDVLYNYIDKLKLQVVYVLLNLGIILDNNNDIDIDEILNEYFTEIVFNLSDFSFCSFLFRVIKPMINFTSMDDENKLNDCIEQGLKSVSNGLFDIMRPKQDIRYREVLNKIVYLKFKNYSKHIGLNKDFIENFYNAFLTPRKHKIIIKYSKNCPVMIETLSLTLLKSFAYAYLSDYIYLKKCTDKCAFLLRLRNTINLKTIILPFKIYCRLCKIKANKDFLIPYNSSIEEIILF